MSARPILAVQKCAVSERLEADRGLRLIIKGPITAYTPLPQLYAANGGGVHPLKGLVSWVHNVVRQLV